MLPGKNLSTFGLAGAANTASLPDLTFSHLYVTATDFPEEQDGWVLAYSDTCDAAKKNCNQTIQLLMTKDGGRSYKNITPQGRTQGLNPQESAGSLGMKGWDQRDAPTLSQAVAFENQFGFSAVGLYIGGDNYKGNKSNLSADYAQTLSCNGLDMIPLWVPLQSLTASGNYYHLPPNPSTANINGHQGAQYAVNKAIIELGLSSGIIYADEEGFTSPDPTVTAFVAGFVSQLHAMGWRAGVYMSSYNWMDILSAWPDVPDDVWVKKIYSNGNDDSGVYALSPMPDNIWVNNQRLRQYNYNVPVTTGTQSLSIDLNDLEGEVAYVPADSSICSPSCDPCDPNCVYYDPSNPDCPAPPPVCSPDDPFCS